MLCIWVSVFINLSRNSCMNVCMNTEDMKAVTFNDMAHLHTWHASHDTNELFTLTEDFQNILTNNRTYL